MKLTIIIFAILIFILSIWLHDGKKKMENQTLSKESDILSEKSLKIAQQYYSLEEGQDLKEITSIILSSDRTDDALRQLIMRTGRRFFLFEYPSDGFKVKGSISFISDPSEKSLLIFLRGGNRIFGLMPPANDFTCMRDYTVISTTYRGGVSEGKDEFGGDDVDDVYNLFKYLPTLQQKLGIQMFPKKIFMLGRSRGAMEMFLALGKWPSLQNQMTKVASLSGLLDIRECMRSREDMRQMFIEDFGMIPGKNEEGWIKKRNPINVVPNLRKDLPILIIQGTKDTRVTLNQGYHMVKQLKETGHLVDYLEVSGGEHSLIHHPTRTALIGDWFEQ
jgi:dipeptidyl aminopeptidase/acylaminoacyl peptidase